MLMISKFPACLYLILCLVVIDRANALACGHCNRKLCDYPTNCAGGLTFEPNCGCCLVCAKVLGETCGGEWGSSGRCDKGLECYVSEFGYTKGSSIGICRRKSMFLYAGKSSS